MKYLSLVLAALAFTILLLSLYPNQSKYQYSYAVPTPTPIRPTPTITEWQTYRNEQYGFEFKYTAGGYYPDDNIEITTLSYPHLLKSLKVKTFSESKTNINNITFNFFRSSTDICDSTHAYFSYKKQNYLIHFGCLSDNLINEITSTFNFFTPQKYTCPSVEWVGCMPSPDSPLQPQCQPDYLKWAKANCPNFKGAAL